MNQTIRRRGWLKSLSFAAVVAVSGAGGLYLSTRESDLVPSPLPRESNLPSQSAASLSAQRFPLTSFDAKDTVEAPALATDPSGRIYLAWASKTGPAERTLFLATKSERGTAFDPPRAISQAGIYLSGARGGKTAGHERRATPYVAADGAALHLAWSEALPGGKGMRMVLASSTDGGKTFRPKQPVHQDPRANATFIAMTLSSSGVLACSWLDDRNGSQQPYAAVRLPSQESFAAEQALSAGEDGKGVCPCCATAVCMAPDGTVFVAFRNNQDGYRDISISRLQPGDSSFDKPFPVIPNTWKFKGCPHDGPSIAVTGHALHVVWMDAHTGGSRCYYARADLADLKFQVQPLNAAGPGSQGNAKLCNAGDGLHVVWEEGLQAAQEDRHAGHAHGPPKLGAGGGRAIQYAYLAPGQASFSPAAPIAAKPGAFQSRPTIVHTADGDVWVAWNELDEAGKAVVVKRLPRNNRHE